MRFAYCCLLVCFAIPAAPAQDSGSRLHLGLKLIEEGVGENGGLDVVGLHFGRAAQLAGVEIGDLIMSVDSKRLESPKFESLRGRLGGKTEILLGVLREGRPRRFPISARGSTTRVEKTEREPSARPQAPPTKRPIRVKNGRTLLWAFGDADSDSGEWFDMTDAAVDPRTFQYGIGKDSIPSIDQPQFLRHDDKKLAKFGISGKTPVIAWQRNGVAKAYPVFVMDRHEIVNDVFAGEPWGVFW